MLSRVVAESIRCRDGIRHVIACLEAPEKSLFVDHVRERGGELIICPDMALLNARATAADIVQVEWWHHPALAAWLGSGELPAMRMLVWSHISGLHVPKLPRAFVSAPGRFLFTSPCSWDSTVLSGLEPAVRKRVDVVFSSGGFDDLPESVAFSTSETLRTCYLGTLNFAKLHPDLLDYIAAVRISDFRLALLGDPSPAADLLDEAARRGLAERLDLRGYCSNVAEELRKHDVLAYLLNPLHYGTTENALLEAMASGVVPVVLDNPAERQVVRHGETGLVVDGPSGFADALEWLATHPEQRNRLARAASRDVRQRFSLGRTSAGLLRHYQSIRHEAKRRLDFRLIFGNTPAEWFRACQGVEAWRFGNDGTVNLNGQLPHVLLERNKGSIFHYQRAFPDDPLLSQWAQGLSEWESEQTGKQPCATAN